MFCCASLLLFCFVESVASGSVCARVVCCLSLACVSLWCVVVVCGLLRFCCLWLVCVVALVCVRVFVWVVVLSVFVLFRYAVFVMLRCVSLIVVLLSRDVLRVRGCVVAACCGVLFVSGRCLCWFVLMLWLCWVWFVRCVSGVLLFDVFCLV